MFTKIVPLLLTVLAIIIENQSYNAQSTDHTLLPQAFGEDVVMATLDKIKRHQIFPTKQEDDHNLMKRLGLIESNFGSHDSTFRPDYFGGIWQLDKIGFESTKNLQQFPSLKSAHERIYQEFQIDWTSPSVQWQSLDKPLYSALAARLHVATTTTAVGKKIPQTLNNQAQFWKANYRGNHSVSVEQFLSIIEEFENGTRCGGKMDLMVVLDESGSVGFSQFQKCLKFTANLFSSYLLEDVRLGFMTFSSGTRTIFPLNNNLTAEQIQTIVQSTNYGGGGTLINRALLAALQLFDDSATTERPGVPKIMTFFTDGYGGGASNAVLLEAANITSFAIGIGTSVNDAELLQIANGDSGKMFNLDGFDALTEFAYALNEETCQVPQKPGFNETVEECMGKKERRVYQFELPLEGLTLFLELRKGSVNSYFSFSYATPTVAYNDGTTGVNEATFIPYIDDDEDGQVFVAVEGPQEANCYSLTVLEGDHVPLITTTSTSQPPISACSGPGYFPDPYDCTKFHQCQFFPNGSIWDTLHSCPPTTVWCPRYTTCDFAWRCPCHINY